MIKLKHEILSNNLNGVSKPGLFNCKTHFCCSEPIYYLVNLWIRNYEPSIEGMPSQAGPKERCPICWFDCEKHAKSSPPRPRASHILSFINLF